MEFKVGDRVVCTEDWCSSTTRGLHGTVRVVGSGMDIGVEFDHEFYDKASGNRDGHKLYKEGVNYAESGNGWWVDPSILIPEESRPNPTVFVTDYKLIDPPELTMKERVMCTVASSGYPYAVKCDDGLLFYSDLPNAPNVFKTSEVKGW